MAVNKITMNTADGERVLMDLTEDNVSSEKVFDGVTFHGADGNVKTGTFTISNELSAQDDLIARIRQALQGKAAGGGSTEPDYKALYQRVEYIESAEEETYPYIITDFIADNSCGLEVVASFPKLQDRIPMGSRLDAEEERRGLNENEGGGENERI